MKKRILPATIGFALVFLLILSFAKTVSAADPATVTIDAPDHVDLGTLFEVDINITDVIGLYGWELKLYFENDLLSLTDWDTTGHLLETGGGTFQVDKSDNDYNATHGVAWIADTLLGASNGVNGTGSLVTLTFNATGEGAANLIFQDLLGSMEGKNIKLGDKNADQIENIAFDDIVEIPEFTSILLLITMLIASSATVLSIKKFKKVK